MSNIDKLTVEAVPGERALASDFNAVVDKVNEIIDNIPEEGTVDDALDSDSENPVQNKAIKTALDTINAAGNAMRLDIDGLSDAVEELRTDVDTLPTHREFDIDQETGCLMLSEYGKADSTDFEIDEDGCFNVVVD